MSEGLIIALIGLAGAILGALLSGFFSVIVAGMNSKNDSKSGNKNPMSCATVGLFISIGGIVGLVVGAFFGLFLFQQLVWITSSEPQVNSPQSQTATGESYADTLVRYDKIYNQNGWCTLWETLVKDDLVIGNCPESITQTPKANDVSGNPIHAAQIRVDSDLLIKYPACATFDKSVATAEGGKVVPWTSNDYIGTNINMKANSFFTLYFRCEKTIAP
jgi:hypothetical protein